MKKAVLMILTIALLLSLVPAWTVSAEAAQSGLVLHYAMTGDSLEDSAGDYDGTAVGSTSWTTGLNGSALQLGGGEDYISVPVAALQQSEAVTVSMWVRLDKIENWTALFTVGSGSSNYAFIAAQGTPFGNAVGLTMAIKANGGEEYRIAAPAGVVPQTGQWSLVTYTQDGTDARLYINGTEAASGTMNAGIKAVADASDAVQARIGDSHVFNDPSMTGAVSGVMIYDHALSAEQVRELAAGNDAMKAADFVRRYTDYLLNDGYALLSAEEMEQILGTDYDADIQWKVTSGNAQIIDGRLYKTAAASEREAVTLSATVTSGGETATVDFGNVTLLDEYAAYVLSFFGGDDGQQKLHLAYSYDGVHWQKLNDGKTVLPTTIGNGNVRDPYIFRKKDGTFAVVATQGWDTTQIYFWDSDDLVRYTNERLKTVTKSGVANLTGSRAWAPEAVYDPVNDQYIVYWSDPYANDGNGCIYANTSPDLETFSDPFVFFDAGYTIIDGSIIKHQGSYYMAFKDERGSNTEGGGGGKFILMAKSNSLAPNSFTQYTGKLTQAPVEGPFLFRDIREDKWYLYYDYFMDHKFGLSVSTDLDSGQWEFLGKSGTMPTEDVRHGGVVPVTQKELERILTGYGMNETYSDITVPGEISIEKGTPFAQLPLPETVSVTTTAGVKQVPVTWNAGGYNGGIPGIYTLTGTLDGTAATVELTVVVEGDPISGDVTLNGVVNVADLVYLKNLILHENATARELKAGDLTGDGVLSAADIFEVKKIILSSN